MAAPTPAPTPPPLLAAAAATRAFEGVGAAEPLTLAPGVRLVVAVPLEVAEPVGETGETEDVGDVDSD